MNTKTITKDPFAAVLESVPEDVARRLCAELDKLIPEYARQADAINIKDHGNKPYHRGPHSREMSADAAMIKKNASHFFTDKEGIALELYVKLVQAIHAAHDIVQGHGTLGDGENEGLSAEDFIHKFDSILKRINYTADESKQLQTSVNEFATKLIVDGTTFNFKTFQQPFITKCLKGELPDSPLLALGCLHIAINDTTRMLNLPEMLSDSAAVVALRNQYKALRSNMLVRTLVTITEKKGAALYTHVRRNLRPTKQSLRAMTIDPDFDNLSPGKLMPILAFMHLFGQNLRANSEFDTKSVGAAIFREYICTEMPKLDKKQINATYDFIMDKMTADVSENSFCQGMRWTESGIDRINAKFKEKYHVDFNVFNSTYEYVWQDYILNARLVISNIKMRVNNLSGAEQDKLKRMFVVQCLYMARNQTGLFIMEDDEKRARSSFSTH